MTPARPALGYALGDAACTLPLAETPARTTPWLQLGLAMQRPQDEAGLVPGFDAVGRPQWAEEELPAEGRLGVALAPLLYYSRRDCHPGIAVDLP